MLCLYLLSLPSNLFKVCHTFFPLSFVPSRIKRQKIALAFLKDRVTLLRIWVNLSLFYQLAYEFPSTFWARYLKISSSAYMFGRTIGEYYLSWSCGSLSWWKKTSHLWFYSQKSYCWFLLFDEKISSHSILFMALLRFCDWFFGITLPQEGGGALDSLVNLNLVSFLERKIQLWSEIPVRKLYVFVILSGLCVWIEDQFLSVIVVALLVALLIVPDCNFLWFVWGFFFLPCLSSEFTIESPKMIISLFGPSEFNMIFSWL